MNGKDNTLNINRNDAVELNEKNLNNKTRFKILFKLFSDVSISLLYTGNIVDCISRYYVSENVESDDSIWKE